MGWKERWRKKKTFYKKTKDGKIEINKNHNWFYQIQGQLHVTKKDKCLFGLWFRSNFKIKTEIIHRDDQYWTNKMETKIKKFYLDCLLPELVDPRHTRQMPIRDPVCVIEAKEQKKTKQRKKGIQGNNTSNPDQEISYASLPTCHAASTGDILDTDLCLDLSTINTANRKRKAASAAFAHPEQPTTSAASSSSHTSTKKRKM